MIAMIALIILGL